MLKSRHECANPNAPIKPDTKARAQHAEGARAGVAVEFLGKRRRAARQRRRRRDTLRAAQQIEHENRRREAHRKRGRNEAAQTEHKELLAAELVGECAGRHQQTAETEHERIRDPCERGGVGAEVAPDGRCRNRAA